MNFNPSPPTVMHVDLNSCFASIEQQANPLLRGKPVVVAAYTQDHGCILAASREAKLLGIKTGMGVREGKSRFRNLIVLPPDPDKYRCVNKAMCRLLETYSMHVSVESIDEMVISLRDTPALEKQCLASHDVVKAMILIGMEIKKRIKTEIGDWLTVSVGIAPNRYLAKVASGLTKPDGLDIITRDSITPIFSRLTLTDLCGIKEGMATRLRAAGIYTPCSMLLATSAGLEKAFHSVVGQYWWLRLHGYEDGSLYKEFEEAKEAQKTFGQSYALGTPRNPSDPELWQILFQLTCKMGRRLRQAGCTARGIGCSIVLTDYSYWHKQITISMPIFADIDFYRQIRTMLCTAPEKPVRILAIYSYHVEKNLYGQASLLEEDKKKEQLTQTLDALSARWGNFAIMSGRMLSCKQKVIDRIAFGKVETLV